MGARENAFPVGDKTISQLANVLRTRDETWDSNTRVNILRNAKHIQRIYFVLKNILRILSASNQLLCYGACGIAAHRSLRQTGSLRLIEVTYAWLSSIFEGTHPSVPGNVKFPMFLDPGVSVHCREEVFKRRSQCLTN